MTLEQIKNEITASLKEVREASRDFSSCESYNDLQSLFKKAIGRVALSESSEDLESVGDLLMAIEELYNDCSSEISGEIANTELFSFDFELDADECEEEISDESINDEENDTVPERLPIDKTAKKQEKKQKAKDRAISYSEKKAAFDQKYSAHRLRAPNTLRLCIGCILLLSGIGFGLVDALWWPWCHQAWIAIGFGCSYLILSAIYSIAISQSSKKAVRSMAVLRMVLAFIMLALSLPLGLWLDEDLTLVGAYIATLPFTLFGFLTYMIYRMRLALSLKNQKKK